MGFPDEYAQDEMQRAHAEAPLPKKVMAGRIPDAVSVAERYIVAIASDGTMWWRSAFRIAEGWQRLPDLPQE